MDIGRPLKLCNINSPTDVEITTEAIQFLQSLNNPVSVVSVIGSPCMGKSYLANRILDKDEGFQVGNPLTTTTKGIWVWSQPIKITRTNEHGIETEIDLLVIDSEAFSDRDDGNQKLGQEIFAMASLISSKIVMVSNKPISETINDLDVLSHLDEAIQIRKNEENKQDISPYLPSLSWVISGSQLKAEDEPAHLYLERELGKQTNEKEDAIRSMILKYFKNRDCFILPQALENQDNITDFQFSQLNPDFQSQMNIFVNYIKNSTEIKKITGKIINGPILCNMVQAYAHRFQKGAPAIIIGAFERAVAAESRRIKEKLFIRYINKMSLIESELPCDEEHLWKEHQTTQKELIKEFDLLMLSVFEQEEVQEERSSLIDRTDGYYEDLKSSNIKASENRCRDLFKALFDPVRQEGLKYLDDGSANIGELEQKFLNAIQKYQNQATGPMMESIFVEEITFLVPFMCSLLRDIYNHSELNHESLEREIKTITRNLHESKANEKRLKDLMEENSKNYEKQLDQRDKQISEIQASVNNRIYIAENKLKAQERENKGLRLELEQAQKEREMMIEAERDIFQKKNADLESKLSKMQTDNSKYEKMLDELRDELEKIVAEKNEQINDLSRRIKLMETQEVTSPRQDASILKSFKEYLEDIYNKFTKEQNANSKYLSQLERVANLQNELNQLRIKEQEQRNQIVEEYEEKLRTSKQEKETISKKYNELLEKYNQDQRSTMESTSTPDVEKFSKINNEREIEIKRLMEEKLELSSELAKREQQLSDQQEVVEAHKRSLEQIQVEIDDKDNLINKLKIENVEEKDDNDILINLMGLTLEIQQRRRHVQTIHLGRIQNQDNRIKVAKILKKYGVPYE